MGYVANNYCLTCNKSIHITGDMIYVSFESSRFYNSHKEHQLMLLPHDKRWEGLDNGTDWSKSTVWWQEKFHSSEYQQFLQDCKQILGVDRVNHHEVNGT